MKKLVLGVTLPGSSRLLDGQVKYFIGLGYQVYLLSPQHPKELKFCLKEGCIHLPVKISNEINPLLDLISLYQIIKHLYQIKPNIVNVGTPKMGLLGILASWLLRYPIRIYTCRGLRYETELGVKRYILKKIEKLTVSMATQVIYVSDSIMHASIRNNTAIPFKAKILGKGSSNGVDLKKFSKDSVDSLTRQTLMREYGLLDKLVIGFVGRITRDKGCYELVRVFEKLQMRYGNLKLIMMGHIKSPPEFIKRFKAHPDIIHVPFNDDVITHMSLFDFLVLPSWREGFPNVPIQAAALGIPVIASNATGSVDSVKSGYNGLIFEARNEGELENTMEKYILNEQLRKTHGENGIKWSANFSHKVIWDQLETLYQAGA